MKILDWVKDNAIKLLAIPAGLGGLEFLAELASAGKDGVISHDELVKIIAIASPTQIVLTVIVMLALAYRK